MGKYKVIKETKFTKQAEIGTNFIVAPQPTILKIGDVIEAVEYKVPTSGITVLMYDYSTPPSAPKTTFLPLNNFEKESTQTSETKSGVKLSLTDKYKALHTAQKVGVFLAGVVVLMGVSLGILELRKKIKKS